MAASSVMDLAKLYTALTKTDIECSVEDGFSVSQIEKQNLRARGRIDENIRKWTVEYCGTLDEKVLENRKDLNMMLLGKTGAGKSATGNLIVGKNHFESSHSSESCTQCIRTGEGVVDDINVCVVDTPGFCDTNLKPKAVYTEIGKVIDYFDGGIDAFLYVFNMANLRFTEDQKKGFLDMEKELFGKGSLAYCFVIITYAETCKELDLNKFLEAEKGTDFGNLLINKLEKRVIAVNNAATSPYEREEMRKQIVRMVATKTQGRYTPDDWKKYQVEKWKLAEEFPECIRFLAPIVEKLVFPHLEQKTYSEIKHMTTKDCSDIIDSVLKEVMAREDTERVWKEKIQELIERILTEKRDRYTNRAKLITVGLTVAQVLATGLGATAILLSVVTLQPEWIHTAGQLTGMTTCYLEKIKEGFK